MLWTTAAKGQVKAVGKAVEREECGVGKAGETVEWRGLIQSRKYDFVLLRGCMAWHTYMLVPCWSNASIWAMLTFLATGTRVWNPFMICGPCGGECYPSDRIIMRMMICRWAYDFTSIKVG